MYKTRPLFPPRAASRSSVMRQSTPKVRTSHAVIRQPAPPKTYINDPDCESLREELRGDQDFSKIDESIKSKFLCHLKEYEIKNAADGNYKEARFAQQLSRDIVEYFMPPPMAERDISKDCNRLETEINERIRQESETFDTETNTRRQKILERHEKENEEFEKHWEEMTSKYRKPSGKLLQLAAIESALAGAGDYDQAQIIHNEVEALTQVEFVKAQKRLTSDYREAKAQLQKTHDFELNRFDTLRSGERAALDANHKKLHETMLRQENVKAVKPPQTRSLSSPLFAGPIPQATKPKPRRGLLLPALTPPKAAAEAEDQEKRRRHKLSNSASQSFAKPIDNEDDTFVTNRPLPNMKESDERTENAM